MDKFAFFFFEDPFRYEVMIPGIKVFPSRFLSHLSVHISAWRWLDPYTGVALHGAFPMFIPFLSLFFFFFFFPLIVNWAILLHNTLAMLMFKYGAQTFAERQHTVLVISGAHTRQIVAINQ